MKKTIILIVIILLAVFFLVRVKDTHIPTYFEIIKDKTNIPIVKVLIFENVESVDLSIEGEFSILNSNNEILRNVKNGVKKAQITNEDKDNGFVVSAPKIRDKLNHKEIKIKTVSGTPIKINERYYIGEVIFYTIKSNKFLIVNQLELESYILGVLPGETVDDFSLEAIKAQAIASRTYALSEIQTSKNVKWQIRNTTKSQIFIGASAINEKFNKAVLETRGIVMIDVDRPFRAYFFSSCGGATANLNSMPWEKEKSLMMVGRTCEYCSKMKPANFNWEVKFSKQQS
jgi:stage II sporulation protein D